MKEVLYKIKSIVFDRFDRNSFLGFFKMTIVFIFVVFALNLLSSTVARYESSSSSVAKASVALYLLDAGSYTRTISLGQIVPSDNPYVYSFYVSNNKDGKRCETELDYSVKFKVTTNLPLTYEVYKNENYTDTGATNAVSTIETYLDDDDTYFRRISLNNAGSFGYTSDQTDVYNLVVRFPSSYKTRAEDYQGAVELVTLIVESEQTI